MSQRREKKIRRLERRIRDLEEEVKFLRCLLQMDIMDAIGAYYAPVPTIRKPGLFRRLFRSLFA